MWSPDSRQLVFRSTMGGGPNRWIQDSDGSGAPTLLVEGGGKAPIAWSADGEYLTYHGSGDLWALPMAGTDREPIRLTNDDLLQFHPTFSPNGKWVAYAQIEASGQWNIYVMAFPGGEGKQRVSAENGGFEPRWRADDGKELVYIEYGQTMSAQVMAVDVEYVGDAIRLETPRALFQTSMGANDKTHNIDQSADGQKFGSPDIKVGRSPGRSDQELCDLGRNRLIHGFFWDLPEQYFLASVDGRLRRPRSGWGACSAAAKSRRKVFNLWLLLDDRWAGDTAQVEPVR